MATFGNTYTEATRNDGQNYWWFGGLFTLSEAGNISKISAYLNNQYTAHAACYMKAAIYLPFPADPAVNIGDLVAGTPTTAIADNIANQWVDFTFSSPVSLEAGDYWLLTLGDANAAGVSMYETADAGQTSMAHDEASYTLTSPLGAIVGRSTHTSIYATYTVPSFTGLTVTKLLNG
jgi:hypothetical protein